MKLKQIKNNRNILTFLNTLTRHLNEGSGLTLPALYASRTLALHNRMSDTYAELEQAGGREHELRNQLE